MPSDPAIERFVRDTLGCACPAEVFHHIERHAVAGVPWQTRIDVGGRLLVLLADADRAGSLERLLSEAVASGIALRDREGFNRFRLVLLAADPAPLRASAGPVFAALAGADARAHLHVVDAREAAHL